PRSMTPPLPSRIRALTIARSCAAISTGAAASVKSVTPISPITVFMEPPEGGTIADENGAFGSPRGRDAIGNEVAPAADLGHVLGGADEGDEVQHRVHGASQESLAAHRPADGHERDEAADPRHRSVQPPCHPALSVLTELVSKTHAQARATSVPPSIERHRGLPRVCRSRGDSRRDRPGSSDPALRHCDSAPHADTSRDHRVGTARGHHRGISFAPWLSVRATSAARDATRTRVGRPDDIRLQQNYREMPTSSPHVAGGGTPWPRPLLQNDPRIRQLIRPLFGPFK